MKEHTKCLHHPNIYKPYEVTLTKHGDHEGCGSFRGACYVPNYINVRFYNSGKMPYWSCMDEGHGAKKCWQDILSPGDVYFNIHECIFMFECLNNNDPPAESMSALCLHHQ